MTINNLQFISSSTKEKGHLASIQEALNAGVKWVQLRVKDDMEKAELLQLARGAKGMCDAARAVLVINDRVELALEVGAHGVHLGKQDMPPKEARYLLGPHPIIGATMNTLEDAQAIGPGPVVDYFGVGPYRHTDTKDNLSPILGLAGYQQLVPAMEAAGFHQPLIAIGGITPADVAGLRAAEVHGVAVASAISKADNPVAKAQEFLNALN